MVGCGVCLLAIFNVVVLLPRFSRQPACDVSLRADDASGGISPTAAHAPPKMSSAQVATSVDPSIAARVMPDHTSKGAGDDRSTASALVLTPEAARALGLGASVIDARTLAMGPARPGPAALRDRDSASWCRSSS